MAQSSVTFNQEQAGAMLDAILTGVTAYKSKLEDSVEEKIGHLDGRLQTAIEEIKAAAPAGSGGGTMSKVDQESVDAATEKLAEFLAKAVASATVELEQSVDKRVEQVSPREHFIRISRNEIEEIIEGGAHKKMQQVLDVLMMGEIPILVGPAGTGKTFVAKSIAKVLGLGFNGLSCSGGVTESKFFGRSIPNITTGEEEFSSTAYIKTYEDGGVFLLDEFDAADDNVMVSLNQSLDVDAGYMLAPERKGNEKVMRHKDAHMILTANTYGTGADRQYVSRNQMDAATMDRFTVIEFGYDPDIEIQICPDAELVERFRGYRKQIMDNGLERIVSYRTLRKAYKQRQIGWTDQQIDEAYFAGWHHDEVVMVRGEAL